jgi:hypothetical protein
MADTCSGKKMVEHIEKTTPDVKVTTGERLVKRIDDAINNSGKAIQKLINKISPKTKKEYKSQLSTQNEVTKGLEKIIEKRQDTTGEVEQKGIVRSIVDSIKNMFRAFKDVDNYEIQQALITQQQSGAMAEDAIQKQLTYMLKDASVDELRHLQKIILTGSMVDNHLEDMRVPMQDSIIDEIKNNPNLDYEQVLEEIKNSPEIKEFVNGKKETIKRLKKQNSKNNEIFKELEKEKKYYNKRKQEVKEKLKNETDEKIITNLKQEISYIENQVKTIANKQSVHNENTKMNNSEIKKITNNLESDKYMKKMYENQIHLNSVIEIREEYFGKDYVKREMMQDETLSLKDVDPNSILGQNEKLLNVFKARKKMYNDVKNEFVNRAKEVLSPKQTRQIMDSLQRFDRYYKNIVRDVEISVANFKNGKSLADFATSLNNKNVGQFIQRMGTNKDIDNNFLYVDQIALGQLYQQRIQLDMIETLQKYDLNKQVLKDYQNAIQNELNGFVQRLENDEMTKQDKKVFDKLKKITKKVRILLENNFNVDRQLIQILEDMESDEFVGEVNGEQMNVFDRFDYVFKEATQYIDDKFKSEVDNNVMTNFYNTHPEFKNVIEYLIGQNIETPNLAEYKHFLQVFASTNFKGSSTANELLSILNQRNQYKKSIEQTMDSQYKDFLPKDYLKTHMITTSNGNPLSYYVGNKKINQIRLTGLVDIQYDNPEVLSTEVMNQLLVAMDDTYLDVLLQNQEVMIIPKNIGNGLIESMTPPRDLGIATRLFNKWLRPLMILSPERILKFNLNTAFMSDVYRMAQTNPMALRNVKESIKIIGEYYKTGKVVNKFDPKDSTYDNKEKIFYEFRKLFGGQFDREMQVINQKISNNQWDKLEKEIEEISNSKRSETNKAKRMLKKYLDIVGTATNFREMILRLSYGLETAREIDSGKEIHYGASKKGQLKQLLDNGENFKFVSGVANQNFIAYKEAGRMAKFVNRSFMPFFLFPEGNVKWHYRLYQNYISEIFDNNISYRRKLENTGKIGVSLTLQLGIAQAVWNLLQRSMFGAPEDEEIPEYLKGEEMPLDDLLSSVGIETNNYLQLGPLVANKFNLAQDVMSFVPEVNEDEWLLKYGKSFMGRVTPLLKAPYEIFMGGDYYSDGNMYPVNDKYTFGDNVARKTASLFGVSKSFDYWYDYINNYPDEYNLSSDNVLQGTVGYAQMMAEYQGNFVTQNNNEAHQQVKSMLYNYMEELGKPYNPNPGYATDKDRLKNAIKLGINYNDQEYIDKMVAEYYDYLLTQEGKTFNEAKSQIESLFKGQSLLHMGNLNKLERTQFIKSLSVSEYELFRKAMQYEKTMFGKYYGFLM